jgi:hypothetical protein
MSNGKRRPASLDFVLMFEDREWTAVPDFEQSGPEDRHYQVRVGKEGQVEIAFGDGERGQRPPTGCTMRLAYRFGRRFAGVRMQQGRVLLDLDLNESLNESPATAKPVCGLQRGRVLVRDDPENRSRLLVEMDAMPGWQAWAVPCRPPGSTDLPDVGQQVWLAFERGDTARPMWLGAAE